MRFLRIEGSIVLRVQAVSQQFAPLNIPTPLCKVRYRKIAGFAEWCLFLCPKSAQFCVEIEKNNKFSVFNKEKTAFVSMIRGPPF